MASLMAEVCGNTFKTKGAMELDSNLKKIIDTVSEPTVLRLVKVLSTENSYNFNEIGTDFINSFVKKENYISLLENRGYKKTTMNDYQYEFPNFLDSVDSIQYLKNEQMIFVEKIKLNSKNGEEKEYEYCNDEEYIIFYPVGDPNIEMFYKAPLGVKFIDFKLDKNNLVHLLIEENKKIRYIISHLSLNFLDINDKSEKIKFNKKHFIIDINLEKENLKKILLFKESCMYAITENNEILKFNLRKRYFFYDNEKIFFNITEDIDKYRNNFIEKEDIQLNLLNMYNYINQIGLNDFKINNRKISTLENDAFRNLFKNRFSNTINGGNNYFDTKYFFKKKKDYNINISDEYFNINGNFLYNYKKGDFIIEIFFTSGDEKYDIECTLYELVRNKKLTLKTIKTNLNQFNHIYFCNLLIEWKKRNFIKNKFIYEIKCNDDYSYVENNESFQLKELPNNFSNIRYIENSKIRDIEKLNMEIEFNGSSFLFKNFYDYSIGKWLINHNETIINHCEGFDCKGKEVIIYGQYKKIGDRISARGKCVIHYSMSSTISFSLINNNGTISEFWRNNQNKNIYFKVSKKGVKIVKKNERYTHSCFLPSIEEFIIDKRGKGEEISIKDTDDLEVSYQKEKNILITDRFLEEPLFHKIFINSTEDISIFREDNTEVTKKITEPFKNGTIIYFNSEFNKTYYYSTSQEQFQYFKPLKSQDNIVENFYFDDTLEINFKEGNYIENLKVNFLECINNIDVFLYSKNEVIKINYDSLTSEKILEINKIIERIKIMPSSMENIEKVFFSNISGTSIEINNNIIFTKKERDSIVYSSFEDIEDIDLEIISRTNNIYVETRYKCENNKLIECVSGGFYIRKPYKNEIVVINHSQIDNYECDITTYHAISDDKFYRDNFKTPGSFFIAETNEYDEKFNTTTTKIFSNQIGG